MATAASALEQAYRSRVHEVLAVGFVASRLETPDNACVVRVKRRDDRVASTWLDARNAALAAAHHTALSCCRLPRLEQVSDWAAGFSAFEVVFSCSDG